MLGLCLHCNLLWCSNCLFCSFLLQSGRSLARVASTLIFALVLQSFDLHAVWPLWLPCIRQIAKFLSQSFALGCGNWDPPGSWVRHQGMSLDYYNLSPCLTSRSSHSLKGTEVSARTLTHSLLYDSHPVFDARVAVASPVHAGHTYCFILPDVVC